MARARNIKPGFFANEELVELDMATRLLFIGLWTIADREGRLEDRPKRIKMQVFPADDVNVDAALNDLADRGFVIRYGIGEDRFIQVVNWSKHQSPHVKEAESTIPAPGTNSDSGTESGDNPVPAPDKHQTSTVPAPPDSLIPDSHDSGLSDSQIPKVGVSPTPPARATAGPKPSGYSIEFEDFWHAYPSGHGVKKQAWEQWLRIAKDPATQTAIMTALDAWKASDRWQRGYVKDAQRWLKDRQWEDTPPPPPALVPDSPAPIRSIPARNIGLSNDDLERIARGEQLA